MDFNDLIKTNKQIKKVYETLTIGGKSKNTIKNYVYAIGRFLEYFRDRDISKLNENDIIDYMKNSYLNSDYSASTYNVNVSAIKYFYLVNFNKKFNNVLLPHAKLKK